MIKKVMQAIDVMKQAFDKYNINARKNLDKDDNMYWYWRGIADGTRMSWELLEEVLEDILGKEIIYMDIEHITSNFKEGELVIYRNGEIYEIGKIKRITNDGAFIYYHEGDTASKTPWENIHKLCNARCIQETTLGGNK